MNPTAKEINLVLADLADGAWRKGPQIAERCGVDERTVRKVAEATNGLISGNDGYKRADKATEAEIAHHVKSLRSRANKILKRADSIESGDFV